MLPHIFCPLDEILTVLIFMFPFLGIYFKQWHAKWHLKNKSNYPLLYYSFLGNTSILHCTNFVNIKLLASLTNNNRLQLIWGCQMISSSSGLPDDMALLMPMFFA